MNDKVVIKWNRISYTLFAGKYFDFTILVESPKWFIYKDGIEKPVDAFPYYPPTNNELSTKIQAEKALNKLLINNP